MKGKRGVEVQILIFWLIAIATAVVVAVMYFVLKGKGVNLIEQIKNIFRFR